jgi:hypothetical protein
MSYLVKSIVAIFLLVLTSFSRCMAADNLLLVTIDGLRWQEVFRGLDQDIVNTMEQEQQQALLAQFGANSNVAKREKLMPFLWQLVAKNGAVLGNRDQGSNMRVDNDRWFSYPGYNELLSGKADPGIVSNDAILNPNVTFLEWLNQQQDFHSKVAVFGSWDAFNAIVNDKRSGIMVNSGFQAANWSNLSTKAKWLNQLQQTSPSPWPNERTDAFTYGLAAEYIKSQQPKVIYVALGDTDEFAHAGNYGEYLQAALRSDTFIAHLWELLQGIEHYRNNTNLLITVDHGRGHGPQTWQHHASTKAVAEYKKLPENEVQAIEGSEQTWLAAVGPDVKKLTEAMLKSEYKTNQVAATALALLAVDPNKFTKDIGKVLPIVKFRD